MQTHEARILTRIDRDGDDMQVFIYGTYRVQLPDGATDPVGLILDAADAGTLDVRPNFRIAGPQERSAIPALLPPPALADDGIVRTYDLVVRPLQAETSAWVEAQETPEP